VLQPAPGTLIITLAGAAAAKANPCAPSLASLEAGVKQQFAVVFPAGFKPANLILEGPVPGLLRSKGHNSGSADLVQAMAVVHHDFQTLVGLNSPPKASMVGKRWRSTSPMGRPACRSVRAATAWA
jgi:hypothetical protein